ncbi:MAG: ribose-phosphate diphosphokinase [Candidatus Aenigmarchaeota archaeon]|nr:ribose-phosphate diphosphokinase [Candidatus Aenigmarchaeota archaeon]
MDDIKDMIIVRSTYLDRDTDEEYENDFALKVHDYIGKKYGFKVPSAKATNKFFSNMEIDTQISESVRGMDVYFIHQFLGYNGEDDPNVGLVALIADMDAFVRASAEKINVVLPWNPYERKDRKTEGRTPITAKAVAKIIEAMGAKRVVRVDMHAEQEEGFYEIPVDKLKAMPLFVKYYRERGGNYSIFSPDTGGVTRAREMAKMLSPTHPSGFIDKRRPQPNVSEVLYVVGDVEGMDVILIDDMVDTSGTAVNAGAALKEKGAKSVSLAATHPVLSQYKDKGKTGWKLAEERLMDSVIDEIVVTDTINKTLKDPDYFKKYPKIQQISITPLFGDAIIRNQIKGSISELFKQDY